MTQTTVVRTAAFSANERASSIVSATYLIGPQRPTCPVLSISMKPSDFSEVHLSIKASGQESERPAFMEFIEPKGKRALATGFGFRLHGGAGRNGDFKTKKSYRTYFRKSYGVQRLHGRIVPEAVVPSFDKLVLRPISNDRATHGSSIRDQVIRDVHSDMGALAARGSWCVLLINSVNRGVYNITERMDDNFLASHLGPGEYDVMKTGETVLSGKREGWDDLRRFVTTTAFSNNANFEELSQRVDIENLTSYMIVNMCLLNFDWPGNNWYAARRVPDGKWIFLCWDTEWGLGYRHPGLGDAPYGVDVDPYAFMDSGGAYGSSRIRKLFLAMIDNPGYCDYYQQAVRKYLKGPLSAENILRHVRRHRDAIAADIETEYRGHKQNTDRWNKQIKEVEHFAVTCPDYFQKHTENYFSLRSSPSPQYRFSVTQDSDGKKFLIYRNTRGQLQRLSFASNGNTWRNDPIRVPDTAPLLAGSPSVYSLNTRSHCVLYRGIEGNLHELSSPDVGAEGTAWRHFDLTSLLQLPPASCDPSVVVVDSEPHIIYADEKSRLRELWLDGSWHHQPLPATPRPAGEVFINSFSNTLHVTCRTMYDVPCEQILNKGEITKSSRPWTHQLIQRIPCKGRPLGLTVNGQWRVVFQPATDWSRSEPFIFSWNDQLKRGYTEYDGARYGLLQARNQRQRFHHLEPIGNPSTPAAGNPVALHNLQQYQHYIAYRDLTGNILEAVSKTIPEGESWKIDNVTELSGAPPAKGGPVGLIASKTNSRHYVFQDQNGEFHELRFDGKWSHHEIDAPGRSK